jgi:hypothetical protein
MARAISSLFAEGSRKNSTGRPRLKRFDARLLHLLAYMLDVVQVILEQDVVLPEVLFHPLRHHGL